MTPREIVIQALTFAHPRRIPRQLWLLPWAARRYPEAAREIQAAFPDDIVTAPPFYDQPLPVRGDRYAKGTYVDEWGCAFQNLEDGIIGEVKEPLIGTWRDGAKVRIPVERLSVNTARVDAFCSETNRFVIAGCCPRIFERLQFLRGTERLFVDLMDEPPELDELTERIHRFYVDELALWAETKVDALMLMDDWGGQQSMLISPDLWRQRYRPLYAQYVDVAHRRGKHIFLHSDGFILPILEDLVELGFDAVNCQVFCMGVETLGERFAARITFWGELDRQQLLPHGSREDIERAARMMHRHLHRAGGLIAQCEFGPAARPENVRRFFEVFEELSAVT